MLTSYYISTLAVIKKVDSHISKLSRENHNSFSAIHWIKLGGNSKTIQKGHFLQEQVNKATKAFYVKSGLLRSYTIDDIGKIRIFMFAPEGWIISDIESHFFLNL